MRTLQAMQHPAQEDSSNNINHLAEPVAETTSPRAVFWSHKTRFGDEVLRVCVGVFCSAAETKTLPKREQPKLKKVESFETKTADFPGAARRSIPARSFPTLTCLQ